MGYGSNNAPGVTMKLQIGKRYVRRDGSYYRGHEDSVDLISEYIEPATKAPDVAIRTKHQDARIKELEALLAERGVRHGEVCEERDQLKARVEELEHNNNCGNSAYKDLEREYKALRTQLAAVTAELSGESAALKATQGLVRRLQAELAMATTELDVERRSHRETEEELDEVRDTVKEWRGTYENMLARKEELQAELATYKQPKLVGSTWQQVYSRGVAAPEFGERDLVLDARDYGSQTKLLGLIRRDTYQKPDGSAYTVASLEPVTEESK